MDINLLAPTSMKIRKRKHNRNKKKKEVAVALEENDNLNCNMICEFENTAAEDRPKDLQIPAIEESIRSLKKKKKKKKKKKLSVTDEEDRPKDLQIPAIGKSVRSLKKKLLVLDVNGILADVVSHPFPRDIKRDAMIANKALFKRPFCSEFLNFCFERFDVAVWSSRLERNVNNIVSCLMGDMSQKLIFCWNISQCTTTNIATLEGKGNGKTLVFKDLRKIWDKYDPDLPWEKGYYNESNTLLLDDSPYKGLLNPPYNSIFPYSFHCRNLQDNALGPGGALRKYLDRLANAEDTSKFVEQHPFGQKPISETSESWDFYYGVLSLLQPEK